MAFAARRIEVYFHLNPIGVDSVYGCAKNLVHCRELNHKSTKGQISAPVGIVSAIGGFHSPPATTRPGPDHDSGSGSCPGEDRVHSGDPGQPNTVSKGIQGRKHKSNPSFRTKYPPAVSQGSLL